MDAKSRAAHIKLVAFDVDGVMTDGGLHYTDEGSELKTFNVQDGLGLKFMQHAGFELAIVTGRSSGVVAARAADLGIAHVYQGVGNKGAAVAPANARSIVKENAHCLTTASGGHGAVREAIEFILSAQGKLEAAFAPYLDPQ